MGFNGTRHELEKQELINCFFADKSRPTAERSISSLDRLSQTRENDQVIF